MSVKRPGAFFGAAGTRPLSRREALRLGLAGALAWLGPSCQSGGRAPEPPEPPGPEPVYELAPADSLYDDFDGHGSFQSYDGRDLAAAGALSSNLWVPGVGCRVVEDPASGGSLQTGRILEISCPGVVYDLAWLNSPREISFADFGSLRADVRLSSRSSALHPSASLNFHTTIPEQPPGRSWYVTLGIFKDPNEPGAANIVGQYWNLNLGIIQNDYLSSARLDDWRALRLDIVTARTDPGLGEQELRIDYFVDGALRASRIPEDSAILIDPSRTGLGPHRSLNASRYGYEGEAVGYFDNVRAVFKNRIS